ncbi:uncharacterized protein [Rutidosis leptorrhynchoides]|uniref:uncharacterized protein n=1 Tax=Rutidosis leptorrhynchoides TaxID=125765 RepID=UPI003A99DDA7
MERIAKLLYDASLEGNVTTLKMLIQEDPLILDKITLNHYDDMPLHIASLLGHLDFVKEVLIRKPELSMEYDSQKRLALHIAAAKGHVEIVRALVSAKPMTCSSLDRDGRNAIHLAAIRGRYEVVKELMQAQPHAARAMVQHDTILHLCVKYNQLEVLKLLIGSVGDHEFVNGKDIDGNTILHLAVADKQIETVNFLVLDTKIDVNAVNTKGETCIEMLSQGPNGVKDHQIVRSLMRIGTLDKKNKYKEGFTGHSKTKTWFDHNMDKKQINIKEKKDKYLENKRNTLMLIATFVATMAFQVGVNPPSGVWQDTVTATNGTKGHIAGKSVMVENHQSLYHTFLISNSLGFVSTLSIVLLLISGMPVLKLPGFLRIMQGIMWVATISMSITYTVSMWAVSPNSSSKVLKIIVLSIIAVWAGLMTLMYIGLSDRIEEMLNKKSGNSIPDVIKQAEIEI